MEHTPSDRQVSIQHRRSLRKAMKLNSSRVFLTLLALVPCQLVSSSEIPSAEERLQNSTLNQEYWTSWRSSFLRLPRRDGLPLVACYRKDFNLTSKPRLASITIYAPYYVWYRLAINGRAVLEPRDDQLQMALRTVDITTYLKKGSNTITFSGEVRKLWTNSWLVIEGIVFGEDGGIVRILTDRWRGCWNAPEGWETAPKLPVEFVELPSHAPIRSDPGYSPPRPYYGRIQVEPLEPSGKGMPHPIYDEEDPVCLAVALLNVRSYPSPQLNVEVMDEFSRKIIEHQTIELSSQGKLDLRGELRHPPLPAGVYRFRFVLTSGGKELERRDYEVACVGGIKQRVVEGRSYEDGLQLKEVWSVDRTKEPNEGEFVAGVARPLRGRKWQEVETRVVEGPAGRYRVLARNQGLWFSAYRYKVKRLFVPHLVVVEYPDDASRSFIVNVVEGSSMFNFSSAYRAYRNAGYQRGEAGIWTKHDLHPTRSNRMRKLHILYWPNEEEASVHITNVSGTNAPAGARRITVYEISGGLPALKVLDAGQRMIGYHTERSPYTMASTYYSGPLGAFFCQRLGSKKHPEFYRNWYVTTSNLIKRMRFEGQNLYVMGHFMYHGTMYPSKLYMFNGRNYGAGDMIGDYIALILRMFERNGLNMISNIEFASPPIISRN